VEVRLYDPPQYEHEVVRQRHENANMGADCGAACGGTRYAPTEARNNLVSGFDPNII